MMSPDDSHDLNVFGFLCLWFGFVAPLRWFEEGLGPRMLLILAGMYQEDSYAARRPRPSSFPAWHVQGWYCSSFLSRCIPSSCRQAKMLGISAGMAQKDSKTTRFSPRSSSIWQRHVHGWFSG